MKFRLEEAMEILNRTPGTLNVLLRGLPDEWTLKNEEPETWSAYDVLGHLILRAERAAAGFARLGVTRGSVVFLCARNSSALLATFLGAQRLGATPSIIATTTSAMPDFVESLLLKIELARPAVIV